MHGSVPDSLGLRSALLVRCDAQSPTLKAVGGGRRRLAVEMLQSTKLAGRPGDNRYFPGSVNCLQEGLQQCTITAITAA